ncbi:lytic transglycosylase domain-containing protein [Campylobacter lanienae]|uniref:lytic transglycosylase domain-containing protein n=1 Tax=Campylobacter lanienae TaxID=75658 RepID=UPI0015D813DE|nr:lytic transglycosylase domain-containing protein [Campylobacter lanienae]
MLIKISILLSFIFCFTMLAKSEFDYIFIREALRFNLSFKLLKAIAITESGLNPKAINNNSNGTSDYGLMQINSIHLRRFKDITKEDLFNPSINIYIGAEVLKKCVNRHGLNYKALNCYNGRVKNNNYSKKVIQNLLRINKGIDYDTIATPNSSIFTK